MAQPDRTGNPGTRHASKQDIRAELRKRRALRATEGTAAGALGEALARVASAHLPSPEPRQRVAMFLSRGAEVPTGALRRRWRDAGAEVLVPWLRDDLDLDWVSDPATPAASLRPGGMLLGPEAILEVGLLIVPALAVDTAGGRLGFGGGSYDRVLARIAERGPGGPAPLVVACVHDDEVLDAAVAPLPREPHDRPVAAALTPRRFLDFR